MDKIQKVLNQIPEKDGARINGAYNKIINHDWRNLDMKKLRGNAGYRVRVGSYRIKFIIDAAGDPAVYGIERRGDHTYSPHPNPLLGKGEGTNPGI